ncbi:hypothetical protein [Ralstonia pickettii]|uniref:hypothetical protein n=1 Tax=Ralstonia pickettii TaxID=329 RepID=UPI0015E17C1C
MTLLGAGARLHRPLPEVPDRSGLVAHVLDTLNLAGDAVDTGGLGLFEEAKAAGDVVKNPFFSVIRNDWRNLLRALCLRAAENAGYAIGITYISSYIVSAELGDRSPSSALTMYELM